MGIRIRNAVPGDATSLVEIASAVSLRVPMGAEQQNQGFLIDISLDQYRYFIAHDHVLVIGEGDSRRLAGFSVILCPRTMAATGIRARLQHIAGATLNIPDLDQQTCAYWEQLVFLSRYAKGLYPVYLAFTGLQRALLRYDNLFAEVVSRPIRNLAPRRMLDAMGWKMVGWIDEDYPTYGRVRYDVYYLNRPGFEKGLQKPLFRHLADRLGGDA